MNKLKVASLVADGLLFGLVIDSADDVKYRRVRKTSISSVWVASSDSGVAPVASNVSYWGVKAEQANDPADPETALSITSITAASPAVFTTNVAHGLSNGDIVAVINSDAVFSGAGSGNDVVGLVAAVTATTFQLTDLSAAAVNASAAGTKGSVHFSEKIWHLGNNGYNNGHHFDGDLGVYYALAAKGIVANTQVFAYYREIT